MTRASPPSTTIELTSAMSVERTASPGGNLRRAVRRGPPRPVTPMSLPVSSGPPVRDIGQAAPRPPLRLEDRSARLVGEPFLGDGVERPIRLERRDRLVDAAGELAALAQDDAEVLGCGPGRARELADDHGVLDLGGGHVERRRQVD